jgi:hypothetical protein
VCGDGVEIIAIIDFYEASVSVYFVSEGQITPSPIVMDAQVLNGKNVSLLFW